MKKKIASTIAIVLLAIIIISSIVFYVLLYGGGLLYFGITYDRISDFILFLIASIIIGFILETVINNIPQVFFDLKLVNKKQTIILKIIFNFCTSILTLSIVDYFMNTIIVPFSTIFLFSLFVTGIIFFMSDNKSETNTDDISVTLKKEVEQLLLEHNMIDTINLTRKNHPNLSMTQIKLIVQKIRQESD